jgi:hypothetical protein
MGGDCQHRPGLDRPGEQRHRGQQIPVRLAKPIGVEVQHLAYPRIGARRLVQVGAQRSQIGDGRAGGQ